MHAIAQLLLLPSWNSAIDFSPMAVAPDTPLLDAIALMSQCQPQASRVLVVENSQVVGWLRDQDIVRLISLNFDLKTTTITEVMATSVITLKQADLQDMKLLSMLRQHPLPLLSVVNEQGQLVGCITCESICHALESYDCTIPPSPAFLKEMNRQLADEIADRQLIEEQLRQSQEMLQLIERKRTEENLRLRDCAIAASNNGIVICDVTMPDSPIIYASPAFERITGYTVAEVIGKNCRFLRGTDTDQLELKKLHAAIEAAKSCTVVLRNYRKGGCLFWNELSISPVYDSYGKFTHYIVIQTDITERKLAETALLVWQERLQYLLSSSPGVIYTCKASADYPSTFISENIVAMMGYEAREFVEDHSFWLLRIHPEDLPQVQASRPTLFELGQYGVEYRFLHQDGTYRWVYDQAKLVRDEAGKEVEIVGYWTDITQRKQLEVELRSALEKEKELNELKSRFISMTSHEFRTPLSTILSSAELLEHYRHKWAEEKQLTHLHRIQTAVKHMTEMLDDVLVIARAEAGRLDFRPTPLDLVEYCLDMVEELQLNVNNQHAIAFSTQHQSMPCCMDEKLLGHILSNLLSNAIKYSPTGSNVNFTLTCQPRQAIFEIRDQGIGIPPEDLSCLFESFHRATNVGNIQGTGLGLAIVKKCVDTHQGEIAVTSQVGVGTTLTVTLPLVS